MAVTAILRGGAQYVLGGRRFVRDVAQPVTVEEAAYLRSLRQVVSGQDVALFEVAEADVGKVASDDDAAPAAPTTRRRREPADAMEA